MADKGMPIGEEVPRDDSGRPLIMPPGGGELEPYMRASTAASMLSFQGGLEKWRQRLLVGYALTHRLDASNRWSLATTSREKDDAVTAMLEAAGAWDAANKGTAMHEASEPGADPGEYAEDVERYQEALERAKLTVVETEAFVVNDRFRVAGTRDHVYRTCDGRYLVGDKKTGSAIHPHEHVIQLAAYAGGKLYSPVSGRATGRQLPVSTSLGLVVHWRPGKPVRIVSVDLRRGFAALEVVNAMMAHRALKYADLGVTDYEPPDSNPGKAVVRAAALHALIAKANDRRTLELLWRDWKGKGWEASHTTAAAQRTQQIAEQLVKNELNGVKV